MKSGCREVHLECGEVLVEPAAGVDGLVVRTEAVLAYVIEGSSLVRRRSGRTVDVLAVSGRADVQRGDEVLRVECGSALSVTGSRNTWRKVTPYDTAWAALPPSK
jgi:hypothetical protein